MEANIDFVDYLLTCSNTWETHKMVSTISSYSSTLLCRRNKIKIEPIFDYDYVKSSNNLNMQQEKNHFECEICTKLFDTKHKLIGHKKVHIGEKVYKCNTCDKMFTNSSNLKSHGKIHNGEKPYKCKMR